MVTFLYNLYIFNSLEPNTQDELLWSLAVCLPPSSTPLNHFSSENPGQIFFRLHVEPSVEGGLKICTNGHSLLIKMAFDLFMENVEKCIKD